MYRIANWSTVYEKNRTREIRRLDWIAAPILIDRDDFAELVDHADGAAHAGVFMALQQVAARSPVRGDLRRPSGQPHDPHSLARLTRLPEHLIADALPRLVALGWIEDVADDTAPTPHPSRTHAAPTCDAAAPVPHEGAEKARLQDITEQNNTKEPPTPSGGEVQGEAVADARSTPTPADPSEPPATPRGRTRKPVALPPIPPTLDTPDFRSAWDAWQQHRREKRSPVTPTAAAQQFADFQACGVGQAVAAIRKAIRCGWAGVFPPEPKTRPGAASMFIAHSPDGKPDTRHVAAVRRQVALAGRDPSGYSDAEIALRFARSQWIAFSTAQPGMDAPTRFALNDRAMQFNEGGKVRRETLVMLINECGLTPEVARGLFDACTGDDDAFNAAVATVAAEPQTAGAA